MGAGADSGGRVVGAFDEHEFADKRRVLKETSYILSMEAERIKARMLSHDQVAAQKKFIIDMAIQLQNTGQLKDVPFDIKRRVIKLVVNQITVDTREQWIRVEGAVSETFALISIAGIHKSETVRLNKEEYPPTADPTVITNNHIRWPA